MELPSLLGCSTAQYGTSGHRGEAWPGVDDADRAGQAATGLPACADVALLTWPAASTCCRFGLLCAAGAGCVAAAAPAGRHLFSPDLAAAEVGGPPLADVGSGASAGFSRAAPAVQRFFFCAHCCSSAFCLRRSLCLFRLCLQYRVRCSLSRAGGHCTLQARSLKLIATVPCLMKPEGPNSPAAPSGIIKFRQVLEAATLQRSTRREGRFGGCGVGRNRQPGKVAAIGTAWLLAAPPGWVDGHPFLPSPLHDIRACRRGGVRAHLLAEADARPIDLQLQVRRLAVLHAYPVFDMVAG